MAETETADPRTVSVLHAHALELGQHVEVTAPGPGLAGCSILEGTVSPATTRAVLVLDRSAPGLAGVVDRVPWTAIWVIRTRPESSR